MKIGIVVLAAGSSSRMGGEPKQLLKFKEKTLLRLAAETALATDCDPVIVVLGANAEKMQPELKDLPLNDKINESWALGLGSSIKTGLTEILKVEPGLNAVIFSLADQPLITAEKLNTLINIFRENQPSIVAATYENTIGVPALFARSMFEELLKMSDTAGAKSILGKYNHIIEKVQLNEAAFDIDFRKDYERLQKIEQSS